MEFMEETIINPCFARHYVDGKIIFRDAIGNITYDPAEPEFYRHRHVEEQNETRPGDELEKDTMSRIQILLAMEKQSHNKLDVVREQDGNIVFALANDFTGLFQLPADNFAELCDNTELAVQLQGFTQPRGLEEPYSVELVEDGFAIAY